ncbi:hypothetical protein EDEG_01225 [Edhazardia aedis USNM 41457]|uniref:Uncharacterized protein n=1 Tax=Edhazardia aedis (strain USNM 41457) TaxID=1003232 RepID=J9DA29_EDHAE|nr:hypothetical protein EDEG_01225 [Edhazardia aedis USNM 41457]|eukprot:EJW04576.1 hypothetical protein EDEG_01225 [Edhazardia aedis USNM 41457]
MRKHFVNKNAQKYYFKGKIADEFFKAVDQEKNKSTVNEENINADIEAPSIKTTIHASDEEKKINVKLWLQNEISKFSAQILILSISLNIFCMLIMTFLVYFLNSAKIIYFSFLLSSLLCCITCVISLVTILITIFKHGCLRLDKSYCFKYSLAGEFYLIAFVFYGAMFWYLKDITEQH